MQSISFTFMNLFFSGAIYNRLCGMVCLFVEGGTVSYICLYINFYLILANNCLIGKQTHLFILYTVVYIYDQIKLSFTCISKNHIPFRDMVSPQ